MTTPIACRMGTWQTHLTPAHVAHLAAQAAEGQPEPPDLQQALLVRALQAGRMPPPDL